MIINIVYFTYYNSNVSGCQ